MYRLLSIITFVLIFIPIYYLIKYLLLNIENRRTLTNFLLLGLFLYGTIDYSQSFYLSTFADYALEEFIDQGHSMGEIFYYMTTGSAATLIGYLIRRHAIIKMKMRQDHQHNTMWREWLRGAHVKK